MNAVLQGSRYRVSLHYNLTLLARLRSLSGWTWDSDEHAYFCDATDQAKQLLISNGFGIIEGGTAPEILSARPSNFDSIPPFSIHCPGPERLREYQRQGVYRLQASHTQGRKGLLLADEMGLGKTIQSLAWLAHNGSARPSLLVTPASVKYNWLRESESWLWGSDSIVILNGKRPSFLPTASVYIINYDIISAWEELLLGLGAKVLVLDEAHRIKNNTAQRTNTIKLLGRRAEFVIALSGTPVESKPIEMFNILQLLDKKEFPNRQVFGMRYCKPRTDYWSGQLVYDGAENIPELRERIRPLMLRRLKNDVLTELPKKQRTVVWFDLDNAAEYKRIEAAKVSELTDILNIRSRLTALMELSATGKFKGVCNWIDEVLPEAGKLFVGVHNIAVMRMFTAHYKKKCLWIDGSVPSQKRQAIVDRFETDPSITLLFGEHQAAGEGINLQKNCSNVAFLQIPWTPGRLLQFEDRVHRFGQTRGVNVWVLAGRGTVDEDIINIVIDRAQTVGGVLDGERAEETALTSIAALLRKRIFS